MAALKNKRIGVLMGGISEEREISLKTGTAILKALLEKGYKAVGIDAGRDISSVLLKKKVDIAFVALHGRYGEDGCMQGLLEVMAIPYTGSGVKASALAMDKTAAKKIMLYHGVSTPASCIYEEGVKSKVKAPLVVKPACQGSAIGVSIVKKDSGLKAALKEASRFGGPVLIEKYIKGRELTVSILDKRVLPTIEIRPKKGFYDYTNKYTKGMTEFIVPAAITKSAEKKVAKESLKAYEALGCSGAARVDVILDDKGTPYVLEVNTIPGMTELSLFPRAAEAAGLDYPALVEEMLKGAGLNKF
ncbi:MAG: D-alanine--D-alanine ligase [Deltaproteobacteria bacterium GWA2_54_12]|nr:MAG: D-alanine--D-alanine ligase [Deltaproteobacteria bacterium GWA2_54_12]